MKVVVVVCALLMGVSSASAAQGVCAGNCPDRCDWLEGRFKCLPGFVGCLCEEQGSACMYYNCQESEEEEEDAAAGVTRAASVHLLDVAGQLHVLVDACAGRPPLLLRLGSGARIEIVSPLGRAGGD